MAEAKVKEEEDFLNLPDDQLPDYPPEDSSEYSSETSSEVAEEVNDDNDEDSNDDTENNEGEASGGESIEADEEGEEDDSEENNDSEEKGGELEFKSGSESSEDENSKEEEEDFEQEVTEKVKPKKAKKKSKATELEATVTSADAQLKELFAPFKANGRDMQVSSIDDAITLMKMGANYNKKMQGLKPNLRLMKMLDNNKLLNEEKLSYLIDLENKNPQAIAKLLKDTGFDPIDHEEDNTDYTPGTYTVNDTDIDLDMVLDDIKDTPSFQKTIDTISNKWDAGSRRLVKKDPGIIRTINTHMENGTYEPIMDIVQNEKALGRLTEMSDLQAYKHVGDTLQAQGAFAPQPQANEKQPAQKKPQDPKLKNRKKAAANTRSKPANKQGAIDPLNLSDEEFNKLDPALM